jgi:hypothetical protein
MAPPPEEQPQGGSIWSQLYSGQPSPLLSAAQEENAQRQARMAAGLQMLMGAGQRGTFNQPAPSLLQILASGMMAGQQAGMGARTSMVQQQRQQELQQVLAQAETGGLDRGQLEQVLAKLIANGDYEGARSLSEYMKATADDSGIKTVTVGNDVLVLDSRTGELLNQHKGGAKMGTPTAYRDPAGNQRIGRYNPETNQMEPIEGAEPVRAEEQEYTMANQLFGRYLQQTDDDKAVADLYGTMVAASRDPSAAGDLSMIFAYMKVLDPGSVVREGEFANAQNTGSVPQRIWAQYNKVLRGERLTTTQRADFMFQATNVARQRSDKLQNVIDWYREVAERRGLNPDDIAYDYYQIYFPDDGSPGGASGGNINEVMPGPGGGQ